MNEKNKIRHINIMSAVFQTKVKTLNYLAYRVVSCLQSMSMGCAIFINFIPVPLASRPRPSATKKASGFPNGDLHQITI